jgi:hypothetical protein
MPGYKSNAKVVIDSLVKKLKGIDPLLVNVSREVAAGIAASNGSRIFTDGKAVDGSNIGNYKEGAHKEKRKKKNKEVNYVNLSFSGTLSKEFSIATTGNNIGIGFITDYGADLHEYLEEKYNKKIWGVTQEDEEKSETLVKNRINKYLNG